jgi:hypothetical protein
MEAVTPRPLPLPRLLADLDVAIAQRRHNVKAALVSLVRREAATIAENPAAWCGGSVGSIGYAEKAYRRIDDFTLFVMRVEFGLGNPIEPGEWSDLVLHWSLGFEDHQVVGIMAGERVKAAGKIARQAAEALKVNPAEPGTARLAADLAGGGQ